MPGDLDAKACVMGWRRGGGGVARGSSFVEIGQFCKLIALEVL